MWASSWSISPKTGTRGCFPLSLLIYPKLKLSSAGCPSWEGQDLIFSGAQLFIMASADAGEFVDVASIRKNSLVLTSAWKTLGLPLHSSLRGCKARVACTCLAGCCVLNLGPGARFVCACERCFQSADDVLGRCGAIPRPAAFAVSRGVAGGQRSSHRTVRLCPGPLLPGCLLGSGIVFVSIEFQLFFPVSICRLKLKNCKDNSS